ncbi:unnamed protein product [Hymenolepis diminuta]|uniref:DUF3795 domain-containing protein n=1 Tax=Hymenolepis diminuta TaxID=6216 RepID=A0A0R3SPE3_HYMDI|nr:unnamed protein product [Hymenolepis diminuta]
MWRWEECCITALICPNCFFVSTTKSNFNYGNRLLLMGYKLALKAGSFFTRQEVSKRCLACRPHNSHFKERLKHLLKVQGCEHLASILKFSRTFLRKLDKLLF